MPRTDAGGEGGSAGATPEPARRGKRLSLVGWMRLLVIGVLAGATVLKFLFAANTFGTNDVRYWIMFTEAVRDYGPIGVYGHEFKWALYNHPPLTSYLLQVISWLEFHGVGDVPFLIRVPATLADVVTTLVVFELVRRRRGIAEATAAGVLVACSPVLIVISGFHGNTDPVFVMFTLLSVYLLVAHRSLVTGALAGASFAAAVSVKLVPVVLLPALLLVAVRSGWRRALGFLAASGAVMALLWGPVVLTHWSDFSENVLGYNGIAIREWGLVRFAEWFELSPAAIDFLVGPGRFIGLLLCAGLPLLLVWRRPTDLGAAAGLSLGLFLLVSPAFGFQYLVWPLAAAYLVNFWLATVYNAIASWFVLLVYDRWNNAYPWNWDVGTAISFQSSRPYVLAVLTWQALAAVVVAGMLLLRRPRRGDPIDPAEESRTVLS
ncbi:glycosyltransferase family 39 protein [Phytohabitans sp. ZYX-F-186]|uniref:Glycosyltransferase family 39 protein n=1 Tax=Phytohabitans maris TaxID=3071409 RepID=A0ABU0ZQX1_9ACTN|nr:glycosyltransferase family 39 protein [Phytohabitans sp. ZYX-F-186]MDQ7908852.1 glycosyltransferase family 39 protein [Phytohabitans sp. ZYX-F-186]